MKKIIIREEDFNRIIDSSEEEPTNIPPSELGMDVINNLVHAIDRYYTVKGLKGGIPGINARLYEKYNLDGLKRELMGIRNSQ